MFAALTKESCYLEEMLLDNGVLPMFENERGYRESKSKGAGTHLYDC